MTTINATIRTKSAPLAPTSATSLISPSAYKSIDSALRAIYPSVAEETKLQRARRILQEVAQDVPEEQLEVFITELQCLIDYWLDCYEREAFDGLTLREVLHEG